MSWTILVNRNEGHNKFWSHNELGDVHWGRIGTRGQSGRYGMDTVLRRENEKLNEGYILVTRNGETPYPDSRESRSNMAEEGLLREEPVVSTAAVRAIRRPRRSQARMTMPVEENEPVHTRGSSKPIKVPEFNKDHTVPNVDSYKTDANGYINYRSDYKRQVFDDYASSLRLVKVSEMVDSNMRAIDSPKYRKAKEYFNKIPSNSQYNKPETFEELRDIHRPTFVVLFSEKGSHLEAVAIFNIHNTNKVCDFLALKGTTLIRTTILKNILRHIATYVSGQITFKLKSAAMRNEIKEVAEYYTEARGDSIKYNVVDLIHGIPVSTIQNKRWIN